MLNGLVSVPQLVGAVLGGVVYCAMEVVLDNKEVGPELLMRSGIFAAVFLVAQVLMVKMGICGGQEQTGWFSSLFK
jgi:hypothetical protein